MYLRVWLRNLTLIVEERMNEYLLNPDDNKSLFFLIKESSLQETNSACPPPLVDSPMQFHFQNFTVTIMPEKIRSHSILDKVSFFLSFFLFFFLFFFFLTAFTGSNSKRNHSILRKKVDNFKRRSLFVWR